MRVIVYPQQFHLPDLWKKKGHENQDVQNQPLGGTEERRDGWQPRQLPRFTYPRGAKLYYFHESEHDTDAPVEAEGGPIWTRPRTFTPWPVTLMGMGRLNDGEAPVEPPTHFDPSGWQPKPLKTYGQYKPIQRFLNNIGEFIDSNLGGTVSNQWMVRWSYDTRYERTVRRFFQRHLQNTGLEFSSDSEPSPISFIPRKLRPFQLPRGVPYSYWSATENTTSAPAEAEASQSWVARTMARFTRPRGATLYYMQSGFGSTSVPVVGTVVGRITGLENRPIHWPTIIR